MRIATWNVNSLKVRLNQILDWLYKNPVDVLCLQETKTPDEKFPWEIFKNFNYYTVFSGQNTYNGVAILSKYPCKDITDNMNRYNNDSQKRFLALTTNSPLGKEIRVVCIYCPNGQSIDSDKYGYKLRWLDSLHNYLKKEIHSHPCLVVSGDYNIAPSDIDVYTDKVQKDQILVSLPERKAFDRLINLGFVDAFRLVRIHEKSFSWWDYRKKAFQRNAGFRIDHILLSMNLLKTCIDCKIDRLPRANDRPSDHTPVIAELDF